MRFTFFSVVAAAALMAHETRALDIDAEAETQMYDDSQHFEEVLEFPQTLAYSEAGDDSEGYFDDVDLA